MKESLMQVVLQDKLLLLISQDKNFKGFLMIIYPLEHTSSSTTVINFKATLMKANGQVKELIDTTLGIIIRVVSKVGKNTGLEKWFSLMEISMRVCGKQGRNMGVESTNGKTEWLSKDIFGLESEKVKVLYCILTDLVCNLIGETMSGNKKLFFMNTNSQ